MTTKLFCILQGSPPSYTLLDLFQLRVVQDRSESFTSYRGVKFNLSRFFLNIPQNIIAFSLDSRYRRYLPIWDKGIPVAC
nr:MAG TPA: hypothetical protein [Bacteriophage sp.]